MHESSRWLVGKDLALPPSEIEPFDWRGKSIEEIIQWAQTDPEPTPLHLFPLQTDEGRRAFLEEFYGVGETAIFSACGHVWNTLAEPRKYRCTLMGLAAQTGGTGKAALLKVLQRFLAEALAIDNPIPPRADFASLDEWHNAAMATFAADRADLAPLLARYSGILNGGPDVIEQAKPAGQLFEGPWQQPENGSKDNPEPD
jgi:hypothetical protein